MKMKLNLLFIFIQFLNIVTNINLNEIKNNTNNDSEFNSLLEKFKSLKVSGTEEDIATAIFHFLEIYTNTIQAKMAYNFFQCLESINSNETNGFKNYLGLAGFSGKGISDLGLEEECLSNNFIYYLLTYQYKNGSFVTFSDQKNAFLFFQQNTFYTGICLTKECDKFLNFLFNKTINDKFYEYLYMTLNIENAKIYDIGRMVNTTRLIEPYDTFDNDGRYNEEKTKNEEFKFNTYKILYSIVIYILMIQFIISLIINLLYKPFIKSRELKNEIEDDDSYEGEDDDENNQIFNKNKEKKEEIIKKRCCESFVNFLNNYFSMFNNIKILLKKKNLYYNNNNLEVIIILRVFCMILITFINNFEVLIKIPSKDFFYEPFYKKYNFFILKFASFSVDMWICLDGFETMYKLISYYKKYIFHKNKSMSFGKLITFYMCTLYKIIAFFILFFMINYFNKYFIYVKSKRTLFEYYSNHIYNDKLDNSQLFSFLIPGYTFYYSYYLKISIFEESIISKMTLLIINEFHIYTIFLLIFYISNLLKSKVFDYFIFIINIILYSLNYFICQFKPEDNTYYSYKLVLDNFLTVRYAHITFNYFFLGAMAGLTCFYYKDSFLNNSLSNDSEYLPFNFCYSMIKIFDCLVQKGRIFWFTILLALQLFICFSFTYFVQDKQSIYIPFDTPEKIVLCYETGLFIFFFCLIIIFIFFIKNDNENKSKNYPSLIYLIERINFSFVNSINLLLYSYYCIFNFQLKLSFQNLWIITFGIFVIVCFENLILTLAFVFPLKIINKKIIKCFIVVNEEKPERISKTAELMDKSRITEEYNKTSE